MQASRGNTDKTLCPSLQQHRLINRVSLCLSPMPGMPLQRGEKGSPACSSLDTACWLPEDTAQMRLPQESQPIQMVSKLRGDYFEPVLIIPALTACSWTGCPAMRWCKMELLKRGNGGTEAGWLRAHIKAAEAKPAAVPSTHSAL